MGENETVGLHTHITADSGNFTAAMERARQQLAEFAVEQKRLNTAIQAAEKELAEQSRKFGKDSEEAKKAAKALEQLYKENFDLKDKIQDVTNNVNKQTQAFAKNAQQGNDTAGQLKSAFTMLKGLALGYAGKTLFSALIGSNAEFEQSMTSFEVLLGSADKAQKMIDDLESFAAKSPLEMEDVTKTTTMLLGYQVAAEDVLDVLSRLGDLARGDAERLDRISLAYGQMLAKGKVTGEELRQMVEAQVPMTQSLADTMGVTTAELSKLLETGQVGIPELNATIKAMTDEGGAFFGMMEKQAETATGMWSTFKDDINIFARQVGEESFAYLKTEMNSLLAEIDRMSASGELQAIAKDIGSDIAGAVKLAAGLLEIIYDMKDIIFAGTTGVIAYKTSFALLTTAVSAFNAVKETFNIITGKSVVVKNLETGATVTLTKAEAAEVTAKNASIVAQTKLNAVMNANPVMAVVSGVLALVSAIVVLCKTNEDAANSTKALIKELDSLQESFESLKNTTKDTMIAEQARLDVVAETVPRLEELANKTNRTAEEEEELKYIIDGLNEAMPDLRLAIDEETGALNRNIATVEDAIVAYKKLAEVKAASNLLTAATENRIAAEKARDDAMSDWETFTPYQPAPQDGFFGRLIGRWKSNQEAEDIQELHGTALGVLRVAEKDEEYYKTIYKEALGEYNELMATLGLDEDGNPPPTTYTPRTTSGGTSSSSKTKDPLEDRKKEAEALRKAEEEKHKLRMEQAETYISKRNFYNNWQADSEEKALERMQNKMHEDYNIRQGLLQKHYDEQLLTQEEFQKESDKLYASYMEELDETNRRLFTLAKEDFEGVLEATADAMKAYYELDKMFEQSVVHVNMAPKIAEAEEELARLEREYEAADARIEKQMQELEDKLAAFERAKEDEDDETRRQRLAYSLEYEHDEDNRRALEKELKKLDEEIAEKNFRREIEEKMSELEERERQIDELYDYEIGRAEKLVEVRYNQEEKRIAEIEAQYERAMSMENITQQMYNYLSQNGSVAEGIGSLMGEQMVDGLSLQLEGYLAAVEERMEQYGLNPNGNFSRSFADRVISQNNSRNYNLTINSQGGSSGAIVQGGRRLIDEIELRSSL